MTPTEETTKAIKAAQITHALRHFTGSEHWYRHALFRTFCYTDGVKYLATEAGAYWLLDRLFASQHELPALRQEEFQAWTLTVNADVSAELVCSDGNYRVLHRETIGYTDFPLQSITLYLTNDVLLLPSEN